jgi:hypothetical protein
MFIDRQIVPGSYRRLSSIAECRPDLQELYAIWDRLRGDREMPARRDFDPTQVPRLLSRMFLVDVLAGPPQRRFRTRLQGTEEVRYHGADWTGSFVHEMTDRESADRLCAVGERIVASREPWFSTGRLYWLPEKPFYHFESVLLPLSDDGATVTMIMGMTQTF